MITGTVIFILGLCVGSFLNVCILRLPKEESIIFPQSHCTNCKRPIPWYDNIPILSFIILGAKCRFCKSKISFQYPLVEVISGILFFGLYMNFKWTPLFFIYAMLLSALLVVTFIDLKYQMIPDTISYSGIVLGVVLSLIYPFLHNTANKLVSFRSSILGILTGGISIYTIGVLGKLIFRKEAMGGGDVKLLAMIGSFLGWQRVILVFFIAPVFGSIVGIILKTRYKVDTIPYGPYLSLATLIVVFWSDKILGWVVF